MLDRRGRLDSDQPIVRDRRQGHGQRSARGLIEGFAVTEVEHGRTHLVGDVPDQARLQGILAIFGNLNMSSSR